MVVVLAVLVVIVLGGSAYGAYYYHQKYEEQKETNTELIKENKDLGQRLEEDQESEEEEAVEGEEDESSTKDAEETAISAVDTSAWLTYTNSRYGYSFKHPNTYTTAGCQSKPCGEFIGEEDGGDRVIMQGDISQVGWPNIDVSHLSSEYYTVPTNTDFRQWILDHNPSYTGYVSAVPSYMIPKTGGGGYAAYDITIPSSPQAYSQRYIIFMDDQNQLFTISMTDHEAYSEDFYSSWLATFIY